MKLLKNSTWFHYAAINHEAIGKHPQRISNIHPFINKYSWKGVSYLSGKDDWKMFEKVCS